MPGKTEQHPHRRQHHQPRWTWNPDRCVEALLDWTRATGEPPRYYEWTLTSTTLRELGLPHLGRVRWEVEYPRWPSGATVIRHHGRFLAGLAAAGLRPPLTEALPLQERVAAAHRMTEADASTAEIADALGVGARTISLYLRAVPCRACAQWVTSGRTDTCQACRARERRANTWTPDEIAEALTFWRRETGELPRVEGWRADGDPRWVDAWPRYPTGTVVVRRCGSWDAALKLAGLIDLDPEHMLERLRRFHAEHGRSPRWRGGGEIGRQTLGASSADYVRTFGSWRRALELADLPVARSWDRAAVAAAATEWAKTNGRPPTPSDWMRQGRGHPHRGVVRKHYGSWDEMLATAGLRKLPAGHPSDS